MFGIEDTNKYTMPMKTSFKFDKDESGEKRDEKYWGMITVLNS